MKKRIPILALTTVLCLSLCTGPALAANAVDASGTASDFESSWQLEALYGTETWTGSAPAYDTANVGPLQKRTRDKRKKTCYITHFLTFVKKRRASGRHLSDCHIKGCQDDRTDCH